MKVVMISLAESIERQKSATEQFAAAGIEFEFFKGINGSTATEPLFEAIDEDLYLLNSGRAPSPGEIGCHASHRAVWDYAANSNESMIILEDDALLEANFADAVRVTEKLIDTYGFIRLQHLRDFPRTKVRSDGGFDLHYCDKYPFGATGYAVSPKVAKALSEQSRILTAPADKFIKNFWIHGQPLYCLLPESITPGPLADDSTIAGRDRPKRTASLQIKRAIFKLSSAIRRSLFNLKHQP